MNPDDLNAFPFSFYHDGNKAIHGQRKLIHGNLISLWEIGIKIILSGKEAIRSDSARSSQTQFDHELHRLPVDHWKRTGLSGTNRTGLCIRFFSKCCRTPTEYLRPGQELRMDFQADNRFIFHKIPLHVLPYSINNEAIIVRTSKAKSLLPSLYKREEFPLFGKEGLGEILTTISLLNYGLLSKYNKDRIMSNIPFGEWFHHESRSVRG
jgi:hypothetical protein